MCNLDTLGSTLTQNVTLSRILPLEPLMYQTSDQNGALFIGLFLDLAAPPLCVQTYTSETTLSSQATAAIPSQLTSHNCTLHVLFFLSYF